MYDNVIPKVKPILSVCSRHTNHNIIIVQVGSDYNIIKYTNTIILTETKLSAKTCPVKLDILFLLVLS